MITINETNVTIMVTDMNQGVSFYESIGLTLKQRWGDNYAMLTAPGLTIGLHPADEKELSSGTVSIGFMVSKISDAKEMLDEQQIDHDPQMDGKSGNYIYFKDPFGTVLYFVEPKWS